MLNDENNVIFEKMVKKLPGVAHLIFVTIAGCVKEFVNVKFSNLNAKELLYGQFFCKPTFVANLLTLTFLGLKLWLWKKKTNIR